MTVTYLVKGRAVGYRCFDLLDLLNRHRISRRCRVVACSTPTMTNSIDDHHIVPCHAMQTLETLFLRQGTAIAAVPALYADVLLVELPDTPRPCRMRATVHLVAGSAD